MIPISRRRFLGWTLVNTGIVASGGCGTLLHPERRGQPAGKLDWGIVALDAVGLLLFFVPGVIAFAVDFTTGTIYLPPDHYGSKSSSKSKERLVTVQVPDKRMSVKELELAVSQHLQQDIELTPGSYQTQELKTIDEFWATTDMLAAT